MTDTIFAALAIACLACSAAGCLYAIVAITAVRRLVDVSVASATSSPAVAVLKPLRGAEPGLYEDLVSFCDQEYGGPVQVLFGVQDASDPAIEVVRRLIAERPGRDLALVLHACAVGPNPKIANLAGLASRIRHDVVIVADADIGVPRHYLRDVVAALAPPQVGAVTLLYRGDARGGAWARLASMGIDYHFLPGVLVGLRLGLAQPCFGSTIALRRETLAAIGGFAAFARFLADDYAIGQAVRAKGMKVAIPSQVVAHSCSERSAADLLRHELRWARTTRALSPLGYAGSIVTHALPWALLGSAFTGFAPVGLTAIFVALAVRLVLQLQVDHTLHVPRNRWWLGPVRDVLAFGIHLASYFVNVVGWRGRRFRVLADGTLVATGEAER
jgi:ceramide glucosyltransferase